MTKYTHYSINAMIQQNFNLQSIVNQTPLALT